MFVFISSETNVLHRYCTISAYTLKFPSEKVLNFFSCAERPSHMLILSWTGIFRPFSLSMGYWIQELNGIQNIYKNLNYCKLLKKHLWLLHYLHEDGPSLSTMFATGLVTEVRVQDLVGWDSGISHTLLSSQHPYDHIWHAVLRLKETWNISITQSFDPVLELHYIVLLITMTPWTFFSRGNIFSPPLPAAWVCPTSFQFHQQSPWRLWLLLSPEWPSAWYFPQRHHAGFLFGDPVL